jgi:hypothetical protein
MIEDDIGMYIQFGGEKSYKVTHKVYNDVDNLDDEPVIRKLFMYQLWLKGSLKNVRENIDLREAVEDWHVTCAIVLEKITEMEENLQWEPKVAVIGKRLLEKHINQLLTAEQFTINILSDAFYRRYGEYYFKRRMIDWGNEKHPGRNEKIFNEIYRWHFTWYKCKYYYKIRNGCYEVINEVRRKIENEKKLKYMEDIDDLQVEIWRWNLVVPFWRLMFEYKRILIDRRLEEEKKAAKSAVAEVVKQVPVEEKKLVTVDKSKPLPVNFEIKGRTIKREINVKPEPLQNEIIPPPILTETEDGYKVESENEVYSNLYLRKDQDDPEVAMPKKFVNILKKTSKE